MKTIRAEDLRPGMRFVGFEGGRKHVAEEVRFQGYTPDGSLLLVYVVTEGGGEFRCYGKEPLEVDE
jgi:hypothetical protein